MNVIIVNFKGNVKIDLKEGLLNFFGEEDELGDIEEKSVEEENGVGVVEVLVVVFDCYKCE